MPSWCGRLRRHAATRRPARPRHRHGRHGGRTPDAKGRAGSASPPVNPKAPPAHRRQAKFAARRATTSNPPSSIAPTRIPPWYAKKSSGRCYVSTLVPPKTRRSSWLTIRPMAWARVCGRQPCHAHRLPAPSAGLVWVNCYADGDITVPFGGVKQSAWARQIRMRWRNTGLEDDLISLDCVRLAGRGPGVCAVQPLLHSDHPAPPHSGQQDGQCASSGNAKRTCAGKEPEATCRSSAPPPTTIAQCLPSPVI